MEKITRMIPVVEYKTTDGKIFKEKDFEKAKIYQDVLDGVKKYCPECHGDGKISVDVGEYGYFEKWVERKCKDCGGKGYLELKWA